MSALIYTAFPLLLSSNVAASFINIRSIRLPG